MKNTKAQAARTLAVYPRSDWEERPVVPKKLGNMAGINLSTIYSILGAKSHSPKVAMAKKLCDALGITLGEFFSTPGFGN